MWERFMRERNSNSWKVKVKVEECVRDIERERRGVRERCFVPEVKKMYR